MVAHACVAQQSSTKSTATRCVAPPRALVGYTALHGTDHLKHHRGAARRRDRGRQGARQVHTCRGAARGSRQERSCQAPAPAVLSARQARGAGTLDCMGRRRRAGAQASPRSPHEAAAQRFGCGHDHRDHQASGMLGRLPFLSERPAHAQELPARRTGLRPCRTELFRPLPAGERTLDGAHADGACHRQDRAHRARRYLERLSRGLPGLVHDRALSCAQRRRGGEHRGESHARRGFRCARTCRRRACVCDGAGLGAAARGRTATCALPCVRYLF